jgi:hypothetical protein
MRIFPWRVVMIVLVVIAVAVVAMSQAFAQRPEVKFSEGHRSPLRAEISFHDGSQRTVLVLGSGFSVANLFSAHTLEAIGSGDSEIKLWLDTISTIEEITDKEATFVMKNGSERRLRFKNDSAQLIDALYLSNADGGTERVQVSKVTLVKFLNPPRVDKEKHAMLNDWRYSPYTGEKLPPVE